MSGCSTTPPPAAPPLQQTLLTPCPTTLPPLTDGTARDVALTLRGWASQYHGCATRHNGLIESLDRRQRDARP
ncbi:hypothetical protein EBB56_09210 [Halomonas sp. YLB-10]|nr:hypothetical protein EBB56_09210 [Halomonas sp. YLB-10]